MSTVNSNCIFDFAKEEKDKGDRKLHLIDESSVSQDKNTFGLTTPNSISVDMTCQYKRGKCNQPRARKSNGKLLRICEFHRVHQNNIKRKSDHKFRAMRKQAEQQDDTEMYAGVNVTSKMMDKNEVPLIDEDISVLLSATNDLNGASDLVRNQSLNNTYHLGLVHSSNRSANFPASNPHNSDMYRIPHWQTPWFPDIHGASGESYQYRATEIQRKCDTDLPKENAFLQDYL